MIRFLARSPNHQVPNRQRVAKKKCASKSAIVLPEFPRNRPSRRGTDVGFAQLIVQTSKGPVKIPALNAAAPNTHKSPCRQSAPRIVGRFVLRAKKALGGWAFCLGLMLPALALASEPPVEDAFVQPISGTWKISASDQSGMAAAELADEDWREVQLPNTWSKIWPEGPHQDFWLRTTLQLDSSLLDRRSGLFFETAQCGSYRVYGDGQILGSREMELAGNRSGPVIFEVAPELLADGELVVAVRFEPTAWRCSRQIGATAPWKRVLIGDVGALRTQAAMAEIKRQRTSSWSLLLGVAFLAIGLYQLQLFMRRREASHHLWFGLAAVDLAALTFVFESPGTFLGPSLEIRLAAVFQHLSLPLLMRFLWPFLGRSLDGWVKWYERSQLALAALVLIMPISWIQLSDPYRWLWVLPFCFSMVQLVSQEVWRGNRDALTMSLGCAAVTVSGSAEVILQSTHLGTSHPLPAIAFVLFTLMLLITLSNRHTRTYQELEVLRMQLEQMVEDRTTELIAANQQLEAEITERRLAEEAMHMLERAVEQSIDGIAVADLQGDMQFINEAWARMHGYEVFELLGYDLTIFHTPEQMQEQVEPLMEKVKREGAHQAEIEHRRRGGGTFPTWQTATFLQDPEGGPVGFIFIARDLTERQRAEEERRRLEEKLRLAEKLESLGSLAGGVAHDYNNMLTGVLGNVSLALQEVPHESDLRQRLRQIEASAERAAELTDQLLAYAGEEQQKSLLIQLNDLIRDHRARFDRSVQDQAKLEVHLKKGLPAMEGDPSQIKQAIANLLANASDSLEGAEGLIMLRTSVVNAKKSYFEGASLEPELGEGRYVFFEVSDTGKGMDDDTRARMFEPFFSTKSSGRGMGLAAVLGIVRAHDGAIKVFSQPGRGTTVEVLFPAREDLQLGMGKSSGGLQAWEAFGTALVVDDEQLVREVAAKVLQRQGFEVLTANNGREALDIYEQRRGDIRLVLLDLTMPEMDGETFMREMARFEPEVPELRAQIILMSGYRERSATQGLSTERLAGFLHKPFRPNELLHKVREVLEKEPQ